MVLLCLRCPVFHQPIRKRLRDVSTCGPALRSMPCQQHFITGDHIDSNVVLITTCGRNKIIALGFELDIEFHSKRHVATDAILLHGLRQARLLKTVRGFMTLSTRS